MEIRKEKAFPRGGKKPALFKTKKKSSFSLFRKINKKSKKRSKQAKKENVILQSKTKELKKTLDVRCVEDLNSSIIQNGMLLLGIVSQITEKIVNVSLPGRIRGVINLANVSEFYTNLIENIIEESEVPSLKEIFQVGDILPVKVLAVSEEHTSLMLTSDPKSINQKLSYNVIEEGFVLIGSVKSKEDHGFIVDFGIEHVNGFLHYEKIGKEKKLNVGQLIRCCVVHCNKTHGSTNTQLSILKKDLNLAVIKKSSTLPIYCFVPGFQFEITIRKKLLEGVEVEYGKENSFRGYIYEDHLQQKFPNLSDLELNSHSIGTLLYVKPLINLPFFKIMPKKQCEWPFKFGDIVSGRVVKAKRSGVVFKVIQESKKAKCFVPISKLKNTDKLLENKSDIINLYPVNKKVTKIRLGNINYMGRFYLGATDKASIAEKYYSVSDLKCGEVITGKIISFGKSSARIQIGKTVTGVVGFTDMTDVPLSNPSSKFKIGQKVKARVMEIVPETRFVRLTMKATLLKEKEILQCLKDCKLNKYYIGTVIKVMHGKLIVKFFNQIKGVLPKHLTPYTDSSSLKENFYEGQMIKCSIVTIKADDQLSLSMLLNDSNSQVKIGKKYEVEVISKNSSGLFLNVKVNENEKCQGFLPAELLSFHHSLAAAFHSTYLKGEKLFAYCVSNNTKDKAPVFGVAEIFKEFYEGKSEEDFQKELTENSVLPFLFRNKSQKSNTLFLQNLIPEKGDWHVKVTKIDLLNSNIFSKYQLLYGRVLKIVEKKMDVSIKLNDVWDKDFNSSLDFFNSYLKTLSTLVERQKKNLKAYKETLYLASSVKGTIEETRTSSAIVRTENGDLALVEGKFKIGQEINGKVVWIDVAQQLIYVSARINNKEENKKEGLVLMQENDNLRGNIAFISEEAIVVELKGRGTGHLAFIPRRRHLNDFVLSECLFAVGEEIKIWITRKDSNYLLAMDRRVVSLQEKIIWKNSEKKLKNSIQSLKRKLESEKLERHKKQRSESESNDVEVINVKIFDKNKNVNRDAKNNEIGEAENLTKIKEEIDADIEICNSAISDIPRLEYDDIDIKSEADIENKEKSHCKINNDEKIILSSSSESENEEECENKNLNYSKAFKIDFKWDVLNNPSLLTGLTFNKDQSSDDDDDDSKSEKKKRRRLTVIEKKEKAKNEEERLRFIEERLINTTKDPESADDFDRAVLSNPNSSALWVKYMAFHIQGTEIEKARTVARRALKAISFREEQEKLNVWIALLNLENLYGSEDSLNQTLNEALQSNEPYNIHLHMLNIQGQANKLQEMEKLGNFMLKKYKDIENMWHDVASAYFSVGKVESARYVLQRALTYLDKNSHISLISKFALMENKYGNPERAQTLYESILASFPKRVDIWSSYVDMLVKSSQNDLARQVLERAISQNLRPRKMKILFKKFITFEEAHGTPENVEKVREAAVEYVQTVGALED